MTWYKIAKVNMTEKELNKKLKDLIRSNRFFINMFKEYNIPIDRIDNELIFEIKDMEGRYSQANGKYVYLSSRLFENGDFLNKNIHFVIHELVHWLTRQHEKDSYFSDPEEVISFSLGMAYELMRGKKKEEIYEVFFPIIKGNSENEQQAQKIFKIVFKRALLKVKEYQI
jgi:hypothetical protein